MVLPDLSEAGDRAPADGPFAWRTEPAWLSADLLQLDGMGVEVPNQYADPSIKASSTPDSRASSK